MRLVKDFLDELGIPKNGLERGYKIRAHVSPVLVCWLACAFEFFDRLVELTFPLLHLFFFSSRRRHTRSVSAFLLNRSSDLIILTLSVSRLLNLLLRLVAFLLFLNPQCLASISRWITASSSWKRFCLFVCRALSSIMVICMLTAIRLLLTFVMSLYLL